MSYKQRLADRKATMKAHYEAYDAHSSAVTAPGSIADTWDTFGAMFATFFAIWVINLTLALQFQFLLPGLARYLKLVAQLMAPNSLFTIRYALLLQKPKCREMECALSAMALLKHQAILAWSVLTSCMMMHMNITGQFRILL